MFPVIKHTHVNELKCPAALNFVDFVSALHGRIFPLDLHIFSSFIRNETKIVLMSLIIHGTLSIAISYFKVKEDIYTGDGLTCSEPSEMKRGRRQKSNETKEGEKKHETETEEQ